jgi:hypothetical protein
MRNTSLSRGSAICNKLPDLFILALLVSVLTTCALGQWQPHNPVVSFRQEADGATFSMKSGTLRLQVCSDSIIRVLYSVTNSFPSRRYDPVIIKTSWDPAHFAVQSNDDEPT